MRRRMTTPIILLIFVFGAACSGGESETEPAEVRFQFMIPEGGDPSVYQPYQDAAKNFMNANPDILVTFQYLPPKFAARSLITGDDMLGVLEGEDPPDIISLPSSLAGAAEKKGLLRDLLQLEFQDLDIPEPVLESAKVNGKLLVLPYSAYLSVVLYNKDSFDEAGLPYPEGEWTWEQFREVSKRLKKTGSVLSYDVNTLGLLTSSLGQGLVSPDGVTTVGFLDSPEAVRAIQWLNAYYRDDEEKQKPADFIGVIESFDQAQTSMIVGNSSLRFSSFNGANKEKLGYAALPYFQGGKRSNPVFFNGYGISAKSKHPQAALEFIQYLTLSKNEDSLKMAESYLPTSKSIAEATGHSDPARSVLIEEMNYAVAEDGSPYFGKAWNESVSGPFSELLHTEDDKIEAKLHELALRVDGEMKRLKQEEEQP